ncbi:MAG: hypothetical protein JWN21_2280 [Sphingomonas bacterium]|nr:hypothetical protein [Sphingomonas bacterium]
MAFVIRARPCGAEGDDLSLPESNDKMPKPAKNVTKRADEPQMGLALRSVYQRTVEEAVPDEMLDLLSKLD